MERIKLFFKDTRKLDFYARWTVRIILVIGVTYIALLKDTSKETVFVKPTEAERTIIVLDHEIIELTKKDSILTTRTHEINNNIDSWSADSVELYIAEYIKNNSNK